MPERARAAPVETVLPADEATRLMRKTLEAGLSEDAGRPVRIRDLRREFLSSSSSFRTERLRASLADGRSLRIFFKDLDPARQMTKARTVRPLDLEPSLRELRMYQSVLSPERLGTLRLYASRWDPDAGIYWMFLEDGGRVVLHNFLDMPRWTAAARWAARFHAATRDLSETQALFLPRYDRAHYERCAQRVREILPDLEGAERDLVSRGLERYGERIAWLSELPRCVIHGQFFGKNIILRRRPGRAARADSDIVVIDWETAALGPRAFDLVSLTSGKWTTDERRAMCAAYLATYEAATGQGIDAQAFRDELAGVALYQALEWLAWWGHHRSLSRHFANFLKELDRVLREHAPGATDR